ncbi:MAG: hypothetical protein PF482_11650 [Desulfobacteraceae bacterium]|jgi:hypothetical protein|nr:hypothetical protein [Desulfobacteraceae bacterium]
MPNLKNLKDRLKKIPELRSERKLSASFGVYTIKIAQSKEKIAKAYRDMEYIDRVFPEAECKKKILPVIKESVKKAKKIYQLIEADPQTVKKISTENSVIKINDYAKSASTKCHDIWNLEITNTVSKWEKLAAVIQGLGAKGGHEFKKAVEGLKNRQIPKNDDEVTQVKNGQKELQKGIANLALEGPFGKFLEATVAGGASPKDLLRPEIKDKLDEFNLWDSFKIRLGQ